MNINSHLLGDLLRSMNIITEDQLEEALQVQRQFEADREVSDHEMKPAELVTKTRNTEKNVPMLGQVLLDKGYITQDLLSPILAMQNRQIRELRMLSSEKLALVIQIGYIINSTVNLVDVLSLIMKYANIVTDAEASTLMLLDEETGELVFSVPTGPHSDELKDIRLPKGTGVAGWVAENQQYVLVDDAHKDSRFYPNIDKITGDKTKSLLCVPMRAKRKMLGVLEVMNKVDSGRFTEDDALLLNIFSNQAAIAIENAMMFDSLKK